MDTGRSLTVKPAKNCHLSFPQIFLGIRQILKNSLHKIYRHSNGYVDTEGAKFTKSSKTCRTHLCWRARRARRPSTENAEAGTAQWGLPIPHKTQTVPFI